MDGWSVYGRTGKKLAAGTVPRPLSRAAEDGLRMAVCVAKAQQWKAENAEAIRSSNVYVEKHGLPLDSYRQF